MDYSVFVYILPVSNSLVKKREEICFIFFGDPIEILNQTQNLCTYG